MCNNCNRELKWSNELWVSFQTSSLTCKHKAIPIHYLSHGHATLVLCLQWSWPRALTQCQFTVKWITHRCVAGLVHKKLLKWQIMSPFGDAFEHLNGLGLAGCTMARFGWCYGCPWTTLMWHHLPCLVPKCIRDDGHTHCVHEQNCLLEQSCQVLLQPALIKKKVMSSEIWFQWIYASIQSQVTESNVRLYVCHSKSCSKQAQIICKWIRMGPLTTATAMQNIMMCNGDGLTSFPGIDGCSGYTIANVMCFEKWKLKNSISSELSFYGWACVWYPLGCLHKIIALCCKRLHHRPPRVCMNMPDFLNHFTALNPHWLHRAACI